MSTAEQRWAKTSALVNLAMAAGMTVPGVDRLTYKVMDTVDRRMGGPGVKAPEGTAAVLANTAGLMLGLVGALLLWSAKDLPARRAVLRWNALGRLAFASLVAVRGATTRLPRMLWGLAAMDLLLAGSLMRRRRSESPRQEAMEELVFPVSPLPSA